jgi:hypothetical protein
LEFRDYVHQQQAAHWMREEVDEVCSRNEQQVE